MRNYENIDNFEDLIKKEELKQSFRKYSSYEILEISSNEVGNIYFSDGKVVGAFSSDSSPEINQKVRDLMRLAHPERESKERYIIAKGLIIDKLDEPFDNIHEPPQDKTLSYFKVGGSYRYLDKLIELVHIETIENIDFNNLAIYFKDKEIIKWCQKFALPEGELKDDFDNKKIYAWIDFRNNKIYEFNKLSLETFYKKTMQIFLLRRAIREFFYNDSVKLKKYCELLYILVYGDTPNNREFVRKLKYPIGVLWDILDKQIKKLNFTLKLSLEKIATGLTIQCESIFDACYYDILTYIQGQYIDTNKYKHIKECALCHNRFSAEHGSQKYCGNPCTKDMYYDHHKRNKKKGDN